MSSSKDATSVAQFLNLEFDVLHRRIDLMERKKAERASVFVGIAGLVLAASITQASLTRGRLADSIVALCVSVIGDAIFLQNATSSIQIVLLYRRAGRIRCFYEDQIPSVRPYLPWASGDDTPPFADSRAYSTHDRSDLIALGISSASAAAGGWLLTSQAIAQMLLAIMFASATYFSMAYLAGRLRKQAEVEANAPYNIHFPYRARVSVGEDMTGHH